MSRLQAGSTVVVDLDGVVWLAGEGLPGAAEAVEALRGAGLDVLFATNNSAPTKEVLLERLDRIGIVAKPLDVITAADAAVSVVGAGTSALLIGEAGLRQAAELQGLIEDGSPEVVVVGWSRVFDFETIDHAASAIRAGAHFVATNDDPTHPTPTGLQPGTGALVAAIATASETAPQIAGKPGDAMVALVRERGGEISAVFGDRPSTDGAFAQRLDAPFGLISSDATPAGEQGATVRAESLLAAVKKMMDD